MSIALPPLPDNDFDPSESSFPWKYCIDRGWKVTFATENGDVAACDLPVTRFGTGEGRHVQHGVQHATDEKDHQLLHGSMFL